MTNMPPKRKRGRPPRTGPPEKTHAIKIGAGAYAALKELVELESKREYRTQRAQVELAVFRCLKANTLRKAQLTTAINTVLDGN